LAPKAQPFDFAPGMTGYYRGLGLESDVPFLGKSYYLVELRRDDQHWEVRYREPGYNHFRGYYNDGALREEGTCLVEILGLHDRPAPDVHNVKDGKYYKPDRSLGSEVNNGTGVQTYWTPQGVKTWQLRLDNYKRKKLSQWYPNGQLHMTHHYVDGQTHGPFVTYYPSGAKKTEGAYLLGQRAGKWVRYRPDGSVESTEEHPSASPAPSAPDPGP